MQAHPGSFSSMIQKEIRATPTFTIPYAMKETEKKQQ